MPGLSGFWELSLFFSCWSRTRTRHFSVLLKTISRDPYQRLISGRKPGGERWLTRCLLFPSHGKHGGRSPFCKPSPGLHFCHLIVSFFNCRSHQCFDLAQGLVADRSPDTGFRKDPEGGLDGEAADTCRGWAHCLGTCSSLSRCLRKGELAAFLLCCCL